METWVIILIVCIGLISLAGLGVGLYFLFKPKTSSGGGGDSGGGSNNGGSDNGGNGNGGGGNFIPIKPMDTCTKFLAQIQNPKDPKLMNMSPGTIHDIFLSASDIPSCPANPDCNFDSLSAICVYNLLAQQGWPGGGAGSFVYYMKQTGWSDNSISAALNILNAKVYNQATITTLLTAFWANQNFNGITGTTIQNYLNRKGKFDSTTCFCSTSGGDCIHF